MNDENTLYLGDGAYVTSSGGSQYELFTSNGVFKSNSVWLDYGMVEALYQFVLREQARRMEG